MKVFFKIIVSFIAIIILVAGFAGFVPGLSTVLGTNKPKDLGQSVTLEDSAIAQEKLGVVVVELPKETSIENSYQLSGQREVQLTLDSKEGTAIMNNRTWKYYPFSNMQLRINPDGTIETSGMVSMSTFMDYANSLGYSTDDVEKALNEYHIPKINMPFYVKGTGSIVDNVVSINVQSFQAGRISVPSGILSTNMNRINSFAQDVISRQNGFSAKKLAVEGEKLVFDGTLPAQEAVVTK